MTIFASLDDAFSEFFELEVSRVEDQSLQQKDKKRRKRKGAKKVKKRKAYKTCMIPAHARANSCKTRC